MFDFKKECAGCPVASDTDCMMPTPEFGCVKKTHDAAKALIKFLTENCGSDDNAIVEFKCNGEHSDLYGVHVAELVGDLDRAVNGVRNEV